MQDYIFIALYAITLFMIISSAVPKPTTTTETYRGHTQCTHPGAVNLENEGSTDTGRGRTPWGPARAIDQHDTSILTKHRDTK